MAFLQSFDKTKLNYEFSPGKLPYAVIVLHGWGVGRIDFYRIFQNQLVDFNLYMWDARNHGRSEIRENATISDLADDLRYFLTDVYTEKYPVIVIGHSMGALTLFEYLSRYKTDRLSKIVIVDQSPKLLTDEEWRFGVFGNLSAEENEELISIFSTDIINGLNAMSKFMLHQEFNKHSSMVARFPEAELPVFTPEAARGLANLWRSFSTKDYRRILRLIDVPTLLLYGEKSQFYLHETGGYMKDNIPGSKLVYFPQGDHSPYFAHEEEFFRLVKSFCKNPITQDKRA